MMRSCSTVSTPSASRDETQAVSEFNDGFHDQPAVARRQVDDEASVDLQLGEGNCRN